MSDTPDPTTALQNRLAEAERQRDQARGIAIDLEQQLAAIVHVATAEARGAAAHHHLMAAEHPNERVYYTSSVRARATEDLLTAILDITWSGTLHDAPVDQARKIIRDGANPADLRPARIPDAYDRLLDENKALKTRIARHEDRLGDLVRGLKAGRDQEREQAEREQNRWRQGYAEGLASALEYTCETTSARPGVHPAL